MMARTHQFVGGSTGFIAGAIAGFSLPASAVLGAAAMLSSTLPDHLEGPLRLPHRRVTHWPALQLVVVASLTAAIITLSPAPDGLVALLSAGVLVGCVMHSAADAMTVHPSGIQLLWPVSTRGYHLLPRPMRVWVGTKSRSEWAFVLVWGAIVLCFIYARFRHSIPA